MGECWESVTGHSRCRCLNGCFCVEPSINPVDLSWLGQCIDGRFVKRLNLEMKRIEIALSSTTWSVTWHSIFGEGNVGWVPGQWKERTATPGHVFVSDSSVTVGLNSVLKLYLKRRLDCDVGNAVGCTPLHVCMFVYFGDLESQNIRLFWVNSDFLLPTRYHQNLLNTSSSQYECIHKILWFLAYKLHNAENETMLSFCHYVNSYSPEGATNMNTFYVRYSSFTFS